MLLTAERWSIKYTAYYTDNDTAAGQGIFVFWNSQQPSLGTIWDPNASFTIMIQPWSGVVYYYYGGTPVIVLNGAFPAWQTPNVDHEVEVKVISSPNVNRTIEIWIDGTRYVNYLDNIWRTGTRTHFGLGAYSQGTTGLSCNYFIKDVLVVSSTPSSAHTTITLDNTSCNVNNDLNVTGNIVKSYAFANFDENALPTSMLIQNLYYPLLGDTFNAGAQLNSSDLTITFPANKPLVTYTNPVSKMFQISATLSCQMATNNTSIMEFRVFKNGVQYPQSCVKCKMDGNDLDPQPISISCLVGLDTNDTIDIRVANTTSSDNIIVVCYKLVVTQI